MSDIAELFHHPASVLVTIAVAVLLYRLVFHALRRNDGKSAKPGAPEAKWAVYAECFFSGILLLNGLAHFSHGIFGRPFPAPYGYALQSGLARNVSNVLWGSLNLVLSGFLFVRGKVSARGLPGKLVFFAGILIMGLILIHAVSR